MVRLWIKTWGLPTVTSILYYLQLIFQETKRYFVAVAQQSLHFQNIYSMLEATQTLPTTNKLSINKTQLF